MWKIISLFYLESLTWQLQILPDTEQKCGKKLNPLQKKKKYPVTKCKANRMGYQHVATPIYLVIII